MFDAPSLESRAWRKGRAFIKELVVWPCFTLRHLCGRVGLLSDPSLTFRFLLEGSIDKGSTLGFIIFDLRAAGIRV